MKADVYSFGVLVLEIISGRGNAKASWGGMQEHLLEWVCWFCFSFQWLKISIVHQYMVTLCCLHVFICNIWLIFLPWWIFREWIIFLVITIYLDNALLLIKEVVDHYLLNSCFYHDFVFLFFFLYTHVFLYLSLLLLLLRFSLNTCFSLSLSLSHAHMHSLLQTSHLPVSYWFTH